jgi:hypothetical protein
MDCLVNMQEKDWPAALPAIGQKLGSRSLDPSPQRRFIGAGPIIRAKCGTAG